MTNNRIAVIESQFIVDYNNPQKGVTVGGTQRYAHQLGKLFVNLGYEVIFLTKACYEVEFQYEDIGMVHTIYAKLGTVGNREFSAKVYDFANKVKADIVCYSDLQLAYWKCYPKSFALQHGIDWDGPTGKLRRVLNNHVYIRAAHKLKRIVCVDTNYINWVRIKDRNYFFNPEKYVYIPNFASCDMFPYSYREWNETEQFVLLYPRRMVKHRGFDLFVNMCETLFDKGYNIKPVLAIEKAAHDKAKDVVKNCKCDYEIIHPSMDEIQAEYNRAFITYVPTLWSEGTSLSAIESICVGCPVIATDVGGLGNIIVPTFNGELLPYDVTAFVNATIKAIENPAIRNKWSKNCENMRKSFDVERWSDSIRQVIKDVLE